MAGYSIKDSVFAFGKKIKKRKEFNHSKGAFSILSIFPRGALPSRHKIKKREEFNHSKGTFYVLSIFLKRCLPPHSTGTKSFSVGLLASVALQKLMDQRRQR